VNGIHTITPIAHTPPAVLIADELRERIITGVFAPGEQINEAQLAAQMNLSRGPVREALQRLVQEGMVVRMQNRGVFVRELTLNDVNEVYQAREGIELVAAAILVRKDSASRAAVAKKLRDIISRMQDTIGSGDWLAVHRMDLEFHTAIVREAGNTRLIRAYSGLAAEALWCMAHFAHILPNTEKILPRHKRLAALLESGDSVGLHDELHEHLSITEEELRSLAAASAEA
jgi:DNA-binding GntR family transcriptional regulator